MTDTPEIVERLRGYCIDWTGEPIVDNSTPRIEIECRELREAADRIARLTAENERLRGALTEIFARAALKENSDD